MKKIILALALITAASTARADGFVCDTADGEVRARLYNETDPAKGIRNPAILVISNPTLQYGSRTIATFEGGETLDHSILTYDAEVVMDPLEAASSGKYLLGTRMGEIKTIALEVDFTYSQPMPKGTQTGGVLTAIKHNGKVIEAGVMCTRYLKD